MSFGKDRWGEPPKIEFREEVRVSTSLKQPPRTFWKHVSRLLADAVKDALSRGQKSFETGGYTIKVDVDSLADMAQTLNKFGGQLFKDTLDEMGGWLHDVVFFATEGVHREIFDIIGERAQRHMRRIAYKTPDERRGRVKYKHLSGKSASDTEDLLSWTVGRHTGPHPQIRTGWLRDSIGYKVIMHSKKEKRRSGVAVEMLVGPGAGKTVAPPYAQVVNDGAGPTPGIHFVPRDTKGRPRMAKGGMWSGFEAKHYMEETADWLVRSTPAVQLTAAKFARIYVEKAIRQFKDESKGKTRKGFGFAFSDKLISDLESHVTRWIEEASKISTKEVILKVKRALSEGEE